MKIVREMLESKEYGDLCVGDTFMYAGKPYMVTNEMEDSPPDRTRKSVSLETGEITKFGSRVTVFLANCELIVKGGTFHG